MNTQQTENSKRTPDDWAEICRRTARVAALFRRARWEFEDLASAELVSLIPRDVADSVVLDQTEEAMAKADKMMDVFENHVMRMAATEGLDPDWAMTFRAADERSTKLDEDKFKSMLRQYCREHFTAEDILRNASKGEPYVGVCVGDNNGSLDHPVISWSLWDELGIERPDEVEAAEANR